MYYKISEFASIMGVTTDTLRLYERLGIIKALKDDKNNYRYFHDLDARNLLWSRWYRSIRIPLSEAAYLVNTADRYQIINRLEQREMELEQEIRMSRKLLKKIQQVRLNCQDIDSSLGKCDVSKVPPFYRLKQTVVNTLLPNPSMTETVSRWMNLLPFTYFSVKIPKDALAGGNPSFEYDWGIAVTKSDAEDFDLNIDDEVEYYQEMRCVSSVISVPEDKLLTTDMFQHMLDFIKNNGLNIDGDGMGHIIIPERSAEGKICYIKIQIPVE